MTSRHTVPNYRQFPLHRQGETAISILDSSLPALEKRGRHLYRREEYPVQVDLMRAVWPTVSCTLNCGLPTTMTVPGPKFLTSINHGRPCKSSVGARCGNSTVGG